MANLDALFRLYAANLEQFKPEHRGSFMCPVCLDVIDPQPDLKLVVAEEHVVPEALGGRITTLTCRPCNNDSGSDLESHLVQHVLVEARKRPHEGTIDIDGAVHRAELHFPESPADKPQLRIIPIRKQSDPRQLNAAEPRMTEGAKEIKLDMSAGYVPLRSLVALIRSAYLLMFRTFGYSYVFDASAQPIREQLANPLVETPALQGVRWRIGPPVAEQTQLLIVVAPLQCFLAVLRLCDDPEHAAAVMLPPPSVGMSFYDGLAENQPRRIQRFCTLSLPDGFLPLTDVWNYVLSQDTNETKSSLSAQ